MLKPRSCDRSHAAVSAAWSWRTTAFTSTTCPRPTPRSLGSWTANCKAKGGAVFAVGQAKGGAVFAVGQATGDTESCELTGANFRAAAERTAKKNADAAAAKVATAAARAQLAGTAQADRAGTSARVAWKAAFIEVKETSKRKKEQSALKEKPPLARIADLEGRGGAGAPGPGI